MPNPTARAALKIQLIHGYGLNFTIGSRFFMAYTGGPPTIADLNSLANQVAGQWAAHLNAYFSNNGVLEQVIVTELFAGTFLQGSNSPASPGTRAGAMIDQAVCTQINFKVPTSYRGGKPKIFLPYGITTDASTGRAWSPAWLANMNTGWNAFIAGVTGLTHGTTVIAEQVSVSYFSGARTNPSASKWARRSAPNPRGTATVTDILSIATRQQFATQRRRLLS